MLENDPPSGLLPACRLSVVVTSRNDDHGGNMLRRTTTFVEGLLQLANKHRLSGELIIVEWNPTPGPRLRDLLQPHTHSECFTIRCIEVPPEIHVKFRNSDAIPLFQMIAKNVGIRRAKGEFVLATNPDILFSDELVSFLATGALDKDVLYRIDRHDVEAEVPEHLPIEEQLVWCGKHLLRVHRRYGSVDLRHGRSERLMGYLGDWYARQKSGRGKVTFRNFRFHLRSALKALAKLVDPLGKVHTNGCGDFTLMARDQWLKLRGYPELPIWSMHVDSLLCFMAVASGMTQVVLAPPMKMFHLEHGNSWVVMSNEDRLRTFVVKPWIDLWLLEEIHEAMDRAKAPIRFNPDDWGLGGLELRDGTIRSDKPAAERRTLPLAGVSG